MFQLAKYLFIVFLIVTLFFSGLDGTRKFEFIVKFSIFYWIVFAVVAAICEVVSRHLKKVTSRKVALRVVQDQNLDTEMFLDELKKYVPILARKRKALVIKDDYGYESYDKWNAEKKSFLKKFNYYPRVTDYYKGFSDDIYLMHLEQAVKEYAKENDVSMTWSASMSPIEYEMFCAEILNSHGWKARTTSASGDQGVDVIAENDDVCVAIQCKLYTSPVGNKAVQEVIAGMTYWGATIGIVVTNAQYTRSAKELAKVHDIYLLHHDDLPELASILEK